MSDPSVFEPTMVHRVVRELERGGVPVQPVLDAAGLRELDLDDRTQLVPIAKAMRLYQVASQALDDPQIGLTIAERAAPGDYGLLGLLWAHHPTLLAANQALARAYTDFIARSAITLDKDDDTVTLTLTFEYDHEGLDLFRAEVLGVLQQWTTHAGGEVLAVRLRQTGPQPARLRAVFGDALQLGANDDAIVFDRASLDRSQSDHDPALLAHLLEAAETHLDRRREATEQQARMLRLQGCTVDLSTGTVARPDDTVRLTTKERALLSYFAHHPNEVVTHGQIEREVWNVGRTVITHAPAVAIRRLRAKIEPDSRHPVNLVTVFGEGWRLVVDPPASS